MNIFCIFNKKIVLIKLLSIGGIILVSLLSLFSVRCKSGVSGDTQDDTINWRPDYNLVAADFHGSPDYSVKHDAASHIFVEYDFYPDSNRRYRAYCYFQRDSWIKKEYANARLL